MLLMLVTIPHYCTVELCKCTKEMNNTHKSKYMVPQGQKITILAGILVAMIVLLVGVEAFAQSVSINTRNGRTVYNYNGRGSQNDYKIEYRGEIEISDDDREITGISRGGYFELSKITFGNRRTVYIRESGGKLIKEFYEGRREIPFEPEGKEWLADVLPDVLRSTGIGAESRTKRIHKQKGVNGVLEEIGEIRSDHIKTKYAKVLLDIGGHTDAELEAIVNRITREVDSDHYLSQILIEGSDEFMQSQSTAKAYFQGVRYLNSDHYATNVLKEAIRKRDLEDELIVEVLNAAADINSDHYITTILNEVIEEDKLNEKTLEQLIETTEEMSSDHYRSVVLKKALREPNITREAFNSLMRSVSDMSSDHYITTILKELIGRRSGDLDEQFVTDIIKVTQDISSDHYTTVVLSELLEEQDVSDEGFAALIETVDDMSSDHYISVVLIRALDKDDITSQGLISIMRATEEMNSDHYITKVLQEVAEQIQPNDREAREAFRRAVRNINSDTYYGRLMRSLDN